MFLFNFPLQISIRQPGYIGKNTSKTSWPWSRDTVSGKLGNESRSHFRNQTCTDVAGMCINISFPYWNSVHQRCEKVTSIVLPHVTPHGPCHMSSQHRFNCINCCSYYRGNIKRVCMYMLDFQFKFHSNHSHKGFASFCIIWLG